MINPFHSFILITNYITQIATQEQSAEDPVVGCIMTAVRCSNH